MGGSDYGGGPGRWQRLGRVYDPAAHNRAWAPTHACVPTALLREDGRAIRVYHAPRNSRGQSLPTYFDVAADDPTRLLHMAEAPIMDLGERGCFDDGGIMPCSALRRGREVWLYYVGWNPSVSVPYRNAVGLAISAGDGAPFRRAHRGAVVDRTADEPFFTASPEAFGLPDGRLAMVYASGTGFVDGARGPEPLYRLCAATSDDGHAWRRDGRPILPARHDREATARATVVPSRGRAGFDMWYTHRGSDDFRDGADAYRIGYAQSPDGLRWTRADHAAGIAVAADGWDSTMLTYPSVVDVGPERYLFYNGNGFGRTGIGVARWMGPEPDPNPPTAR